MIVVAAPSRMCQTHLSLLLPVQDMKEHDAQVADRRSLNFYQD